LELLASGSLVSITEDEMRRHFATLPADQVSSIARLADEGKEKLGKWDDLISEVFVSIADRAALIGELPDRLRIRVLDHRPELIDRDTASRLPNDALVSLARKHTADDRSREIANALVRRDFGYASSQLFGIMPLQVFAEAIPEAMKGQLAPSWETAIRDNYQTVLTSSWPAEAKRSSEVAWGLSLMGYPSQADRTASFWSDLLDHVEDDVIGEQRMRFQAFLLRSALNDLSPASWKLATRTLPELRPLILENKLPSDVRRMLASELPRFNTAGYWNIDKRVLLSLSRLMHAHSDEKALNSLGLNDRDMATVIFGMDEEEKYSERRSWWW
jgi:hypothetical protein